MEKEKLLVQAISPFPTMFSTQSKAEAIIFGTFNLSSANFVMWQWVKAQFFAGEIQKILSISQKHVKVVVFFPPITNTVDHSVHNFVTCVFALRPTDSSFDCQSTPKALPVTSR